MRHDFVRLEQAAFWLHVVVAVVLLGYLIHGKHPADDGWITLGQQMSTIEFSSDSLLPESTPSGKSAARPPTSNVAVTNASFSASTTCRREAP